MQRSAVKNLLQVYHSTPDTFCRVRWQSRAMPIKHAQSIAARDQRQHARAAHVTGQRPFGSTAVPSHGDPLSDCGAICFQDDTAHQARCSAHQHRTPSTSICALTDGRAKGTARAYTPRHNNSVGKSCQSLHKVCPYLGRVCTQAHPWHAGQCCAWTSCKWDTPVVAQLINGDQHQI